MLMLANAEGVRIRQCAMLRFDHLLEFRKRLAVRQKIICHLGAVLCHTALLQYFSSHLQAFVNEVARCASIIRECPECVPHLEHWSDAPPDGLRAVGDQHFEIDAKLLGELEELFLEMECMGTIMDFGSWADGDVEQHMGNANTAFLRHDGCK